MYAIEIKLADKAGWHTPTEAQAYYGRYARNGVTLHWWNTVAAANQQALTHDGMVSYFLNQAKAGNKSVNYIVSDSKITMLVNPDNVAWTSQSGNPTTISIEIDPRIGAEGYKKLGWLVKELESRYNKGLLIYRHAYWFATQCCGVIDENRVRTEADKWKAGGYNPAPAPTPVPVTTAKLSWHKFPSTKDFITNKQPTRLWNFNSISWNMEAKGEYVKGHRLVAYGQVTNETLGATYYLTEYSYTKKITNGFNVKDLDPYVAPAPAPAPGDQPPPVPEPPKEQQPQPLPENPPAPVEPTLEERVGAIEAFILLIKSFFPFLK